MKSDSHKRSASTNRHDEALAEIRAVLIGMPVSHVWRGYGSAIFLEFGALRPRVRMDGSPGNSSGEITLGIEWSWRFERRRSIAGGAWSDPRRWPGLFRKISGATVVDLRTIGTLPEIELSLSNGVRIVSFMIDEGQPQWHFVSRIEPSGAWHVERGRIVHVRNSDTSEDAGMRSEPK